MGMGIATEYLKKFRAAINGGLAGKINLFVFSAYALMSVSLLALMFYGFVLGDD
jgi:hypothetical protein